jgi:hypothetical protein
MLVLIVVLAIAFAITAVIQGRKLTAARAEITALNTPKPFGLKLLRAVAGQIVLTAEALKSAFVTATLAGMPITVPDDIAAENAAATDKIDKSNRKIASLTTEIGNQRSRIADAKSLQAELAEYTALLPPAPTK